MCRKVNPVLLACPVVILSGAALLSDVAAAGITVVVMGVYLASLWTGRWWLFLVSALVSVLSIPILTSELLGLWGIFLTLPALPAVAFGLQSVAIPLLPSSVPVRLRLSSLAVSTMTALACGLFIAVVAQAILLATSCALLFVVFLAALFIQYRRLGRHPLLVEVLNSRVSAGTEVRRGIVVRRSCRSCCNMSIRASAGVKVESVSPLRMDGDTIEIVLSLTPLLGGPKDVNLRMCVSDELGLVWVGQSLHVLHLNVIPRARAAQAAAMRFLERGELGESGGDYLAGDIAVVAGLAGGGEYIASRPYVPGDSIRTVDWKHTAKLRSLVVKTFGESSGATGLILLNRGVSDADEADRLVYKFLSGVLAVVGLSQGAALGLYGDGKDERIGPALEGHALVRRALDVSAEVRMGMEWGSVLQPVSLQRIQARGARLRRLSGETASRLSTLLGIEERAMQTGWREDPVGRLTRGALHRFYPAWCIAFSAMQWDAGSLLSELHRLETRGVRTLLVDVGKKSNARANRA